jgi:hypothetical protein
MPSRNKFFVPSCYKGPLFFKNLFQAGGVVQMIEFLPHKCDTLGNTSNTKPQ